MIPNAIHMKISQTICAWMCGVDIDFDSLAYGETRIVIF